MNISVCIIGRQCGITKSIHNLMGMVTGALPTGKKAGVALTDGSLSAMPGTDDLTASQFAPEFAPTTGKPCTLGAIVDKVTRAAEKSSVTDADAVSVYPVKRKDPLTIAVNESWKWAAQDSNLRLPPCEDGALTN